MKYLTKVLMIHFITGSINIPITIAQDSNLVGKWQTIDDETKSLKSIVEIYQDNGVFKGKIIDVLKTDNPNRLCSKCISEKHNRPVKGLEIISNVKELKKNTEWGDGQILDPENGKTYKLNIKLINPFTIQIKGYIGVSLFGRSQYWYKVED